MRLTCNLFLFLLLILSRSESALASNFTAQEVKQAISTLGPIMKIHPSEEYLMDDPKTFLEDKSYTHLLRGAIIPDEGSYESFTSNKWGGFYQNYANFRITSSNLVGMNPQTLFPSTFGKPNFHYFVAFDDNSLKGNQSRASRLIAVKERGQFLYLTFWFFYPFNGPGRAFVGPFSIDNKEEEKGRHYGDWEHVTLRVAKDEASAALKITGIFMSRHGFSPWYGDLSRIQMRGTHPIIFIAQNSHAHYPQSHDYIYDTRYAVGGTIRIQTYDSPRDGGTEFDTSKDERRVIVASNVSGLDPDPAQMGWWTFRERWGQYIANRTDFAYVDLSAFDKEVERGPTPPIAKDPDEIHFSEQENSMAFGQATNNMGNLDVFALADDVDGSCCNLQHNFLSKGNWAGWTENFGQPGKVTAILGSNFRGDAHFFVIGQSDKTLYHNWLNNSGWQSGWKDGSFPASGPVLLAASGVSTASGQPHLEVFAVRDGDGAMMHTWTYAYQGSWAGWEADFLGFPRKVSFIGTARAFGNLQVVALDKDGTPLFTEYANNNWRTVTPIAGAPKLQSLFLAADNPMELLGIGTDQHLWHASYTGGGQWSGWDKDFQGAPSPVKFISMVQGVSLLPTNGGNLEAFLVKPDGSLLHNWRSTQNGTWSTWGTQNFYTPASTVGRVRGAQQLGANMEVFAITTSNECAHTWQVDPFGQNVWNPWQSMLFDASAELAPQ